MNLTAFCEPDNDNRCKRHGSLWIDQGEDSICMTERVLTQVAEERERQFNRYGANDDLDDGTGPDAEWIPVLEINAKEIETVFREEYEAYEKLYEKPTYMHLIREEVAEAFQEDDSARLVEELIQVSALCASWVETIQSRDQH